MYVHKTFRKTKIFYPLIRTQETKPGNNHTPATFNETNEIKKSLDTLTKIHQEHSETSNKDVINMPNTDKELAKQANKISE